LSSVCQYRVTLFIVLILIDTYCIKRHNTQLSFCYSSVAHAGAIQKKEEKIAAMDEDFLKDLAADEISKQAREEQKLAKKSKKVDEKVRQRLAAEKKAAAASGKKGAGDDDEEEDVDFQAFAKKKK